MYDDARTTREKMGDLSISQGSMIGLSEKLLHQFVEYMANRRMKSIGLTPVYEQKSNPLPWIDHWLNSKGTKHSTRNRNRKLCYWWNKTRR